MKGEHKTPEYLAKNPFGQVPLLIDVETTTELEQLLAEAKNS